MGARWRQHPERTTRKFFTIFLFDLLALGRFLTNSAALPYAEIDLCWGLAPLL